MFSRAIVAVLRCQQLMSPKSFVEAVGKTPSTPRMPVLFIGHGSPMNGVEMTPYAEAWQRLGGTLPRPRAILSISAHWLSEGTAVHGAVHPQTIHDFYGFPEEMYRITYPCPGHPDVARETQELLRGETEVAWDENWGLDHGTWIVLRRTHPQADVPTFQLSIDMTKSPEAHYRLGAALAPLRERGVLIMGSGNIVHNLGLVAYEPDAKPFAWAEEFDAFAAGRITAGDHQSLLVPEKFGQAAALSIPTPDHYFPLLYAFGAAGSGAKATFPVEGIAHASVSMRAVLFS